MPQANLPVIPQNITVHLGRPNADAPNITVPFIDYIKNVASSEIYPTWPENAIRANIYAQISYALNRIYTEFYRTQGYDFDITNSTQFDQSYVQGRDVFENISRIVDDIFNDYVVKQGSVEPYFTQYCNGTTVTCQGLSQWGTVDLAQAGLTPYEILQRYYGNDINIVTNAPVQNITQSYPGFPLSIGDSSNEVRTLQVELNRIANNYPSIPVIDRVDGVFGVQTQEAVRKFQEIFNLEDDGIVGKATWYKIKRIYNGVKQLNELSSEGVTVEEVQLLYPTVLQRGDSGVGVSTLQYYLAVIGYFNSNLPVVAITGDFDEDTYNAVLAFQNANGLTVDGIVGRQTWAKLSSVYDQTVASLPQGYEGSTAAIFPGETLKYGSEGDSVRKLQTYLGVINDSFPQIPAPNVTGFYGDQTTNAIRVFQNEYGLPPTGNTGAATWNKIAQIYNNIIFVS
ncbi:MAG: peptidoglycan-binding protein [Oscillospiraceae bacterium]|nr:peptidoglycan-binding protein [Oscillospiraceae bacterium]